MFLQIERNLMQTEDENKKHAADSYSIDELFHRSIKYRGSEAFIKFVDFISKMNHYSRFNSLMVYAQNEAVTFFGSRAFWQKRHNREIHPEARAYIILVPRGPVTLAYDIFDTMGDLSPENFLKQGLGYNIHEVSGELPPGMSDYALWEAKSWGIKVVEKPLSYFNSGYIKKQFARYPELGLKQGFSPKNNFPVLMHELGHLFLGHLGYSFLQYDSGMGQMDKSVLLPDRSTMQYNICELEAETVSYLICKKAGLETRSAEYLAGYIHNEEDLNSFSYETVMKTADKIEKLFVQKNKNSGFSFI